MKLIASLLIAAALIGGCGEAKIYVQDAHRYAGKIGQERYCRENGWRYDAATNECRFQ